jgi:transcriptional regulator with XRE-family HTH domain
MTDREIFRENLNYYLCLQGKKQKDLADYVGAKTTTVSGWTRGISYPRADAMEKIAMFFGIPTSKLVGKNDHTELDDMMEDTPPQTIEAKILAKGIDKLPQEQREQALAVIKAMFIKYADYFDKEDTTDDA